MLHKPIAYLYALLALLGINIFFRKAAESDFLWLIKIDGLENSPDDILVEKKNNSLKNTKTRLVLLRAKTIKSFLWVISALFVALLSYGSCFTFNIKLSNTLVIISVISFSWATLGRLGWNEGSNKGTTIFEQLDKLIFWFLYWIGTFCGIASVINQ